MGVTSQRKGRKAEIELVHILQGHGIPAEPGQAVSYGATPDVVGLAGIHVEVKRRENINLSAALELHIPDQQPHVHGVSAPPCRRRTPPFQDQF